MRVLWLKKCHANLWRTWRMEVSGNPDFPHRNLEQKVGYGKTPFLPVQYSIWWRKVPSWELTYSQPVVCSNMMFLFSRWNIPSWDVQLSTSGKLTWLAGRCSIQCDKHLGNMTLSRWWQLKYFLCSPRTLEKSSNLRRIFFKWVETTN